MENKKFTCTAVLWFDSHYGNTYHSVRIIRHKDNITIVHPLTYGYGEHYKQTTLKLMLENNWLPRKYNSKTCYRYDRENGYPINWIVSFDTKKNCTENGKI